MKKILTITMTVLLFWISVSDLFGASGINRKINFQGKVVNKGVGVTDGTNVADGNYDFKFSLWSTVSAGTSLWSENWNSGTTQVPVSSGIFSVALGTYATFPPTVDFNSDSLYLSVNYNGDGEMSPRIQMAAVPYAFNAEKVAGLTVTNTTGTLTVPNGKTIAFGDGFTTTGVGITLNQSLATTDMVSFGGLSIGGSASVTTNLSVGGSVTFDAIPIGTGTTVLFISGGKLVQGTMPSGGTYTATNGLNLNGSAFGLGGSLTADTSIDTSSFGFSIGINSTSPSLYLSSNKYVGIGTSNPLYALNIGGTGSLGVGGSVTFSGLPVGGGTSMVYISNGILTSGTLPAGSTPYTATNGLNLNGSAFGLGGTLTQNTQIGTSNFNLSFIGLGGTQSLFIGSSGFVGIGTTNPLSQLVVGSGTTIDQGSGLVETNIGKDFIALPPHGVIGGFSMSGFVPGEYQEGFIRFAIGNDPVMRIDGGSSNALHIYSDSNINLFGERVGIGFSDPAQYQLDVRGDVGISTNLNIGGSMLFGNANAVNAILDPNNYGIRVDNVTQVPFLSLVANNEDVLYASAISNIGIGSSDPEYKLHVVGSAMISSKLGIGATSTSSFNVSSDARIGTNLSVGNSVTFSSLPVDVGTSVLYISSSGVISKGTLPVTNLKTIVLSPEYPGASLSADGSGTTSVAMTSDNTLNAGGVGWKNYYQLSSTNAALQDYSVIVRVTLPADFATWQTGACPGTTCALEFAYQTGVGTTDDNYVSYIVSNDIDTPGTAVCSIGSTANTSWGLSGCAESVLNDGGAPEWDAAGETAVIRIKMAAKNTGSALVRAGDITLRYLSRF